MANDVNLETDNTENTNTENIDIQEKSNDAIVEDLKKEINVLKGKLTTCESKKDELIKKRDELIKKTLYAEKKKIEDTYNEILLEAKKRVNAYKNEKIGERKKNLKTLIDKNTNEVRENNIYLKNEISKIIKENKLPMFVNSHLYFSLWFPHTFLQVLTGFFIFLLVIAIPTVLTMVIYKQKLIDLFPNSIVRIFAIAFIYAMVILIFGLIWLVVNSLTKKNVEPLKEIKDLRKNINDNIKEIEKIAQQTTTEMSDEQFDYTNIDREIEAGNIEIENREKEKEIALSKFENATKYDITKKITDDAKNEIENLENEIETTKTEIKQKQKEHDDLKIKNLENGNSI